MYCTKLPYMQNCMSIRPLGAILRHFLREFAHFAPPFCSIYRDFKDFSSCFNFIYYLLVPGEPDGSFVVRDSSDHHYIFSLTFKLNGFVRHVRIEHDQGWKDANILLDLLPLMYFRKLQFWELHQV